MQNILAMHSHYTKSDHSHISKDILGTEFFALNDVILDFLGQTASISILHDDIYAVILNKRFHELNQSGSLEYTQKLYLIFSTFLILII